MSIRNDNSIEIILNNINQFRNKSDIRSFLLNQWIQESPSTKYRYFVETLSNGNRIYLERPGRLNKGCDFVIYIESYSNLLFNNGNDKPPKHSFILDDLTLKKQHLTSTQYNKLLTSISDIYECKDMSIALSRVQNNTVYGESYELILKVLRWMFIEQDITYWAKSGREMLNNAILDI